MKKQWDVWEIRAIEFLKRKGYNILATNYHYSTIGEIDIVAFKDGITVFVEVKYRTNEKYGQPVESITKDKCQKIYQTILSYIDLHQISEEDIRFDVVSIDKDAIEHIEGFELTL